MVVVNDIFPGPEIRVHKGNTVYINVHNQGSYGLTIHWHGIMQLRNPWSDGPEYITQCPLQPGTNFTYKVLLSTEEGTVWWYAHSDWYSGDLKERVDEAMEEGTSLPLSDAYTINIPLF
ncbi:hypothetical protein ACLB2K_013796 [Fragaria x ananassa]